MLSPISPLSKFFHLQQFTNVLVPHMNPVTMAQALLAARRIKKKIWPAHGEALFWSGQGVNGSVQADALQYAHKHGLMILSQALTRAHINIPPIDCNLYSNRLWEFASATYARLAEGVVYAIVGEKRLGSIWEDIELPLLIKNSRVQRVVEIDVRSQPAKKTTVHEKVA